MMNKHIHTNRLVSLPGSVTTGIVALLIMIGCETVVDVDIPDHEPVIVANCLFSSEEDWQLHLCKSRRILDNDSFENITDATVHIYEDDEVVAILAQSAPGLYNLSQGSRPIPGHEYTLVVSAPGLAEVSSCDSLPIPVQIARYTVDSAVNPENITIYFTDPPDIKNYYQVLILQEYAGSAYPIEFESDDLIFETWGGVEADEAYFEDSLISGQSYALKMRLEPFYPVDYVYILLLSVSESYYKYMQSTKELDDNPFVEPLRAFGNINNGFGIFAGYTYSVVRLSL